ncbi:MAG: HNH endonuclease [Terriglobia bacterium]
MCGTVDNLQVHHIQSRGQLGHDSAENLITLCARCHEFIHRNRPRHVKPTMSQASREDRIIKR